MNNESLNAFSHYIIQFQFRSDFLDNFKSQVSQTAAVNEEKNKINGKNKLK